jgi:hypothetical protein
MARVRRSTVRITEAYCRCCGCSDAAACPQGCAWVLVDREKGRGICSSCDPLLQQAIQLLLQRARRKEAVHT